MGGQGSGRWGSHRKQTTVEETLRLPVSLFSETLTCGQRYQGTVSWKNNELPAGTIGYMAEPTAEGVVFHLRYTADEVPQDYPVQAVSAPMPRGGKRWFFLCPECGRKASKLYKKPGRARFACRTCLGLTYESCQESHRFDGILSQIAKSLGGELSPKDVERILKQGTR